MEIDDIHPNAEDFAKNHYRLGVGLARMNSWLPEKLSRSDSINRLVGRAISTNASGNYEDGASILAQAEERLVKLKVIEGRLHYTLSAFLLVFVAFASEIFWGDVENATLFKVALFGGLGGAFSIAIGFSSLDIDLDARTHVNCLIGCSRIFIAIAAAAFSYFSIKALFEFSFILTTSENPGFYMIAMVSGFAEMLVPNIMSNLARDSEPK